MPPPTARVLLVEPNPALRELNETILQEAGCTVETPPDGVDAVAFAMQSHPQGIVLGIHYNAPQGEHILDQLQANPTTRDIPVVVTATTAQIAAHARATPIARYTIVEPYDIQQLENAVCRALKNPPPAATLPPASQPTPAAIAFATEELAKHARFIVLAAISELQGTEPYNARLPELTPGMVDNLGVIFSAINEGVKRSLPPTRVYTVPAVQQAMDEHVALRKSQGIDLPSIIREYQTLCEHIGRFLQTLVGQDHFTAQDVVQIDQVVQRYLAELVRRAVQCFAPQ